LSDDSWYGKTDVQSGLLEQILMNDPAASGRGEPPLAWATAL